MHDKFIMTQALLLLALGVVPSACTTNDTPQADDATTGDTDNPCNLGELGCECNGGLCFPPYECVAGTCVDPNCTPGSEFCECAAGDLCLGDLECVGGICTGDGCTPESHYRCNEGNVHWYDSCGELGEVKQVCDPATQNCTNTSDTTAECVPKDIGPCNDGKLDPGENCDLENFDGATCMSLGFGGGQLACTDICTIDTSNCLSCGNGVIDGDEDCDGRALGLGSCMTYGFDQGELSCSPSCTHDQSGCYYCDCDSGTCCDGCDFSPANTECEAMAETQYGCPNGTEPGDDVSRQTRARLCSGFSEGCDGAFGPWSPWQVVDNCGSEEFCQPGSPTCQMCDYFFDVTQYECNTFSAANGGGLGGGEIFEICGTTNPQTGQMTITARKYDNSNFGSRPYQVRVSEPNDDPCGPNAWFFVVSDSDPVGIGTSQLSFSFASNWQPGQTQKAYCVTASTQPGDLGYDGNNEQQQSWWYSDKLTLTRQCN
jgi:hypothetical protein